MFVTGVAQSMLNYPGISRAVISSQKCYEHLWWCSNACILKHGTVTSSSSSASIAKPDSYTKSKNLAL